MILSLIIDQLHCISMNLVLLDINSQLSCYLIFWFMLNAHLTIFKTTEILFVIGCKNIHDHIYNEM